ncbi:hypothetical protein M9Y10_028501 [Tritrichomonas musculus]|uniref:RRM domain-containing protein n=1 Tax=Tritrichomonas musculus TaxID=1915356 RepID=A0ABR2KJF8_9EUKA
MSQLWVGRTEIWEDEEKLMKTIRQKCNIKPKSVWFCRNKNTNALEGYGFIGFETPQEAAEVMRMLQDTPIPHSPAHKFKLNWGTANAATDSATTQQASGYSVYVGNLPTSVDDTKLLNFFRRFIPQTISARLIFDADKISRGYGFVKFNTLQEMKKAIKMINGSTEFGERPLKVSEAKDNRMVMNTDGSSGEQATNILFIRDIDPDVVQADTIFQHFRPYGKVLNVRIIPDHPDWANVTMETVTAAEIAKKNLQGARFGGSTRCDIQFGKNFDDNLNSSLNSGLVDDGNDFQGNSETSTSVPIVSSQKMSKKALVKYFDEDGVSRTMDYIKTYAEMNRRSPISMADELTANAVFSKSKLKQEMMDIGTYSDFFSPPSDPFVKLWK